jgi:hypothetical protein
MVAGSNFEPRHPGKKALTIFSQGNANKDLCKDRIEHLNLIMNLYGWEVIDSLICCGATNPDFEIPAELLEQAFEDGKRLVTES